MKVKIKRITKDKDCEKTKIENTIPITKETAEKIIEHQADLALCLTIFANMYNYVAYENYEKYPYCLLFCIQEGVELIKKHHPESDYWKNIKSLIADKN